MSKKIDCSLKISEFRFRNKKLRETHLFVLSSLDPIRFNSLYQEINQFIDDCEYFMNQIKSSGIGNPQYSPRTFKELQNYLEKWSEVNQEIVEVYEDLSVRHNILSSIFSSIRFFFTRNVLYSADDTCSKYGVMNQSSHLLPISTKIRFQEHERRYSENDLPK